MKRKLIMPCDVAVKRYYRMYVEVEIDADEDCYSQVPENAAIVALAKKQIVDDQDDAMDLDPDLEIEEHDICWVNPDQEGWWTEEI